MNAYAVTEVSSRVPASMNSANVTWNIEGQPSSTQAKKAVSINSSETSSAQNDDLFLVEPNFVLKKITFIGSQFSMPPEVFYSAGVVGNNQALTGTLAGASGSSAGVGLNVVLLGTCQINMTLAKPIRLTQVTGIDRGWQGLVNVVALF